jgi:nucleotide-binding universal stress UspA family protein
MKGIVVGVDGSEGSVNAVKWAAEEARARGAPLNLVLAWHLPSTYLEAWAGMDETMISQLHGAAEHRLGDARAAAAANLEGLDVRSVVVQGAAPVVLLDAAADADLLVVGRRGHGGFTELLLGSTSQQCAHHTPCPIVVIPPRHADG